MARLWNLVENAWAGLGPLLGVVLGAFLAKYFSRKQWLLDQKTAEYRRLLDALSDYTQRVLPFLASFISAPGAAGDATYKLERREHFMRAQDALYSVLADRIYIRGAVDGLRLREQLNEFVSLLDRSTGVIPQQTLPTSARRALISIAEASQVLGQIHGNILDSATRELGIGQRNQLGK